MDEKLNILITYLEEEKSRLLQQIENYVKENEYLLAHFHSDALYSVNRKIQTLKNIDDRFYDEKTLKQNIISNLEERLQAATSDYMKEYFSKDLLKQKEELLKLNLPSKKVNISENKALFDETLSLLINKKIKSFTLILQQTDNLLIQFQYFNNVLRATLPFVKRHVKQHVLFDHNINSFITLGFTLQKDENKLVLSLSGKSEIIMNKLQIVLSKIVFEILHYKQFENESYIQIKEKLKR